ncbi:MAG: hypothetical protein ACOCTS_02780 [Thermodesulfobacteriota bacterium]
MPRRAAWTALLRWMLFAKANALGEAFRQLVLHYFHAIPAADLAEAIDKKFRDKLLGAS